MPFDLKTFFIFYFVGSAFYFLIYYLYIYLNRIEKKYGIEKVGYDSVFSRILRCTTLSSLALKKPGSWFYKRFERQHKNDWYGQQYLKKLPREAILPYRKALLICVSAVISMYMYELVDYMGWNFSFVPN